MSNERKITISCTSKDKPEPVEITLRKPIDGFAANETCKLRIKGELGFSPWEDFILVAAVIRDHFDEKTNRVTYILAKAGDQVAFREAADTARRHLQGPEAKAVSLAFPYDATQSLDDAMAVQDAIDEADGDPEPPKKSTALVKVGAAARLAKAEKEDRYAWIAKARKKAEEEEESEGEPFELSAEPPPAEVRAKLIEEIEEAEKGAAGARTRMKKAASQLADAVDSGLSQAAPLADYRTAKAEWFGYSNDLVQAQDRLRSFDASLKAKANG